MREFPDIVIAGPDFGYYLWLIIPAIAVFLFLGLEFLVERWSLKRKRKPVVGVGFVLAGIAALIGVSSLTPIQEQIEMDRTVSAVSQLEDIGFQEVRITLESGTFGAYYDGELMRGALVPVQNHPGEYRVIETPPPA